MELEQFKEKVQEILEYGVEYSNDFRIIYGSTDTAGDPEAVLEVEFGSKSGSKTFKMILCVDENNEIGIHTHDYFSVPLNNENIFATCLFQLLKEDQNNYRTALERIIEKAEVGTSNPDAIVFKLLSIACEATKN